MFPNPVQDVLTLDGAQFASAKVMNLNGQVLIDTEFADNADYTVNLTSLAQGIYLVQATDLDGNSTTQRIVKQ